MADDVLVAGAPEAVKSACLLQRAFSKDATAVLAAQHQKMRTFALDANVLLHGSAPWELRDGMVHSLHGDSANWEHDVHGSGILAKMTALPRSVTIAITCALILAMLVLAKSGRSNAQSAVPKGFGVPFHVFNACISGFLRGYSLYIIGPLLTPIQRSLQLCFPCADGESDMALAACICPLKEFAVSSVALGAIFGGLAGGHMADVLGRRLTLLVSDVLFIVSSIFMAMAGAGSWSSIFFVGRTLLGVAVGVSGPASHAYVSELVLPQYRGQLLTLIELALIAGVFTVYASTAMCGDERWRVSIEFPVLPALLQLFCMSCFCQESPRWLAANGQTEEAEVVMESLGLDPSCLLQDSHCTSPKKIARQSTPTDKKHRSAVAMLFHYRRRVMLAIGCALAHNALGANIVMYYSRDILQLANIANSVGSQLSLGTAKAIGTIVAFVAVDRCGRRFLLIVGVAGAVMGHIGLVLAFLPGAAEYAGRLAWASLLLFLTAWDLGWASLMSVVISEVLPDDVRGLGLGASCSLYWLVSFIQAQTMETMFKYISIAGTFASYGIASIFGLFFVLACVPETCGRPLEAD